MYKLLLADTSKSHLIPYFEINTSLYKYLSQITDANSNHTMPDNIKKLWKEDTKQTFNAEIINDSILSIIHLFIPLDATIFAEQLDIINVIKKHIHQ